MRGFLSALTVIAVIALAFWAYRETHLTQQALAERRALEREIGALREALAVQRAEWAYLNRPERLAVLAEMNFDRLGLMPFAPDQFGEIDQVPYPPRPMTLPSLGQPVETMAATMSPDEEEPL